MKAKEKYRVNKGRLCVAIIVLVAMMVVIHCGAMFVKYPEIFSTTWRNNLEYDLANGDQEMLEYYNRNYVANGKYLFGDKYIRE